MLTQGAIFQERYEILSLLGRGGFGEVYKARQPTTGQLVALKLMRLREYDVVERVRKRTQRFMREMKLCAQLHHPNIVPLLDVGHTPEGQLFAVFSFIPGQNLAELIDRQGALEPGQAKHLMLQVLDALACAHKQKVVHRDIKPSNIMVTSTGARLNALVLDFGMGALLDGEVTGSGTPAHPITRLTASEEILGTVGYAAPEQLRGHAPVPASDLFSWALVLIECLTGQPVYAGSTLAEIMHRQLASEPVAVPDTLQYHPLGELLQRVTAKEVASRNVSAEALLRAVESCELRGLTREALVTGAPFHGAMFNSQALMLLDGETPSPDSQRGERRQVTALCCSLRDRDSSPSSDVSPHHLDAAAIEEQDADLRELMDAWMTIAHHQRGYVVAVLGAQLLVYFGYPRAQEDDTSRAARAALAMRAAFRERVASRNAQAELDLHIGIHTGIVITTPQQSSFEHHTAVGSTSHMAAQVMALAPPDGIAVTAAVKKLLRASFSFELRAGHDRPREGDEVTEAPFFLLGEISQSESTTTLDTQTSFVGREQEVSLLLERWRRVHQGVGQCTLIVGEAGLGKSRLTRELRGRLSEPYTFIEGRCAPYTQNSALYPFIDLLERLIHRVETEGGARDEQASRLGKLEGLLARYELVLAEMIPLFAPLLSIPFDGHYPELEVSAQRRKELTLDAFLSLLCAFAEDEPIFLLVEDLHWADPTTIELLTQVVREVPSAAIFAVFTARPEFFPPFPATGMLQLHLNRLEPDQVRVMIGEIALGQQVPSEVIERVSSRTDGVPLFVEELMQMMIESEMIALGEHGYELTGALSDAAIPSTLRALLTARLDRFEHLKETAQLLAAIGREVELSLLTAVSALEPARVRADLDKLVLAGLVRRRRARRVRVYTFKHALIRDTVYELLPEGQRRAIHARIASIVEEQFSTIVKNQPELLAYHHAAADQKQRAIEYTKIASKAALQSSSYPEAIAHATLIVEWAPTLEASERIDAELAANGVLTQALMATRGWADLAVIKTVERSRALLDELGQDSEHHVPMLSSLFNYYHVASDRPMARSIAEELVAISNRTDDKRLQVSAELLVAFTQYADGHYADARKSIERALDRGLRDYDLDKHRAQTIKLGTDNLAEGRALLAMILWLYGETQGALDLAQQTEAWVREVKHIPTLALTLLYLACLYQHDGDREKVAALMQEVLSLSQQYGLSGEAAYGAMLLDWANGTSENTTVILGQLEQMGCKVGLSYYSSLPADVEAANGQIDAAVKRIDRALLMCQENNEHYYEAELYRRRASYRLLAVPEGDEVVRGSLDKAAQLARQQHVPRVEALAISALLKCFGPDDQRQLRLSELIEAHPTLATCAGVEASFLA